MAERKPATKATQKSAKRTTATSKKSKGFTDEERAAMKARARELKAEERASKNRAEGERDVLAAIAAMKESDRPWRTWEPGHAANVACDHDRTRCRQEPETDLQLLRS